MSGLVGNPEDRFSRVAAHMKKKGSIFLINCEISLNSNRNRLQSEKVLNLRRFVWNYCYLCCPVVKYVRKQCMTMQRKLILEMNCKRDCHMSRILRNPVFRIFDQVRHKLAYTPTEES